MVLCKEARRIHWSRIRPDEELVPARRRPRRSRWPSIALDHRLDLRAEYQSVMISSRVSAPKLAVFPPLQPLPVQALSALVEHRKPKDPPRSVSRRVHLPNLFRIDARRRISAKQSLSKLLRSPGAKWQTEISHSGGLRRSS